MCPPASSFPRRPRLALRVLALAALAGLAGAALVRWTPARPKPCEVLRTELILVDGRLCRTGSATPFTGRMIERSPDATLRSRSAVIDGLLDGLSEGWHTNGQLQVRERFVRGVSQGLRTKWYPSGATQSQATVVGGRLEGRFQRWHENGRLAEEVMMRRDRPEGLASSYDPDGRLLARVLVREGQVVEERSGGDQGSEAGSPAPRQGP